MNLTEVFGFDEMFSGLVGTFPEFKLHVRRADDQTIVSANSNGLLAIAVGNPGEQVGPVVRKCLVDLNARLVVRDNSISEVVAHATPSVRGQLEEREARAVQLENAAADLREELGRLQGRLAHEDVDSLDSIFDEIRTKRVSLAELTEQLDAVYVEIDDLSLRLGDVVEDEEDDDVEDDSYDDDDSWDEW